MDRKMMNEWLKAQSQKQQLTERSFQQKRLGVAITEQLTPKEEKFAKANRHILSEMVKRYGSDKGTQLFYSSVREQVKKLNEEDDKKTYPHRFPTSIRPEAGIYVQTGRKKSSDGETYQIDTDEYGNLGSKFPDDYTNTITRPSASDSPISNPRVYSNYNDPNTLALDPALIDRYGAAKEKTFNKLSDTFRKGQDRDNANNVSYTQSQQNQNNNYLANKFATQAANTFSGKGLLNRNSNPSIQRDPELAGQQAAMHDWEGEMIGRRNALRVDASRSPH